MKKLLLIFLPVLLVACSALVEIIPTATQGPDKEQPTNPPTQRTTENPAAPSPTTPEASPTESAFPLSIFTPFPPLDQDTLIMDGFFDDWGIFAPLFVDPAGDSGPSGVDFTEIYAAHTETHLLLKVTLGKTVNLQSEPALELVVLQGDDVVSFKFGDRRGRINGRSVTQEEVGVITLPTVTSDEFEIAIPYNPGLAGDIQILFTDPNDGGDLASPDGEPLAYTWENPVNPVASRTLDRPENTLRVVSWNVLRDHIFDQNLGPHFERVLQALQPDLILIQEIYIYSDKTALNRVTEWLGGEWYAKQQGDLITISRFPFIEDWRESNYNLRSRIFPTLIDVRGTSLLVFNAHLSCCEKDQERQDEVDSWIGFLRQVALPPGTPYILAGDLNLVGDAQQLSTLLTGNIIDEDKFGADFGLDWDGSTLTDLIPRHTHSHFTTTWRDDNSSFAPGRLDFVIYSDSVINAQGFVLDTSELPEEVLKAYGLLAEDTDEASDHLPLIADIVIIPAR